jgi:hypothetical protein
MKRVLTLAALALLPAIANADVGVGASLRDSDAAIYLPIEASENWRIEPFFAWSDEDLSGPGNQDLSQESQVLGAGLFRKLAIHDRTQVYLGARLAYTRFEATDGTSPNDLEGEGYFFEPTLGVEYRIIELVAVSLEGYVYVHRTDEEFAGDDYTRDTVGTANRLLVRVYFPP